MYYFGPKKWGMESIPTVEIPIGQFCMHCNEYVSKNDFGVVMPYVDENGKTTLKPLHRECFLRPIIGSVLHQQKKCRCFGFEVSNEEPNMTPRQAAQAAVAEYERQHKDVETLPQ